MANLDISLAAEEIRLVHRIYKDIIGQPWFPRTDENCGEFAKMVLRLFRGGMDDEHLLKRHATAAARERFVSVRRTLH